MVNSITNLRFENAKLKDRFDIVARAKKNSSAQTPASDTIRMAHKNSSGILPSFMFGSGGGSSKIAKQTRQFNDVLDAIMQTSNKIVARESLLRNKLKKVDSEIKPDYSAPKKSIDVLSNKQQGSGLFSSFDNFKGQLKYDNPVLDKKEEKMPEFKEFDAEDNLGE